MNESATSNATYATDTRLVVPPFNRRIDGDTVIIGNQAGSSFLSLPADAVELLDLLAAGHTVGQARDEYQSMYGVVPDLDEFIDTLVEERFVQLAGAAPDPDVADGSQRRSTGFHFEGISREAANRVFSRPVLAANALVIVLALVLCALDPSLIPPPTIMVVERDHIAFLAAVVLFSGGSVFLHELAHLVAARAAGVPSRMGFGTRLWIIVAETDLTGIWLASRPRRILAFLAGPLLDLTSASILVIVSHAEHQHWLTLDPTALLLVRICLFMYLSRLLWQFFFFVPTDLYYSIGAVFGCKNLMHDTQDFLLNIVARFTAWLAPVDQSNVPEREMRVVRWFALVWLAGRGLAFASLFFLTLPILAGYVALAVRGVTGDSSALIGGPLLPAFAALVQGVGVVIWVRRSSLRLWRNVG